MDVDSLEERKQLLFQSCKDGSLATVQQLLTRSDLRAHIDSLIDGEGNTALIVASENGHKGIVKLLLECGVNVDKRTPDGWTALMKASEKGDSNLEIIELLLRYGARVDLQNSEGDSALIVATQNRQTEVVIKLVQDYGANVDLKNNNGWTALMKASQVGCAEVVELLFNHGAEVNQQNSDGQTALMIASRNGHIVIVKLLLKFHAKVDIKANDSKTALVLASQQKHTEAVELLLEYGAKDDLDFALACVAASKEVHIDTIKLLLECGARADYHRRWMPSALEGASENGRMDIVKLLLDNGSHEYLGSAMAIAIRNGHINIVKVLLDKDSWSEDDLGWALVEAILNKHDDIIELLLKHGAQVNEDFWPNVFDQPPLVEAVKKGDADIVKLLLEHGAKQDMGRAITEAILNEHDEIIQLLSENGAQVDDDQFELGILDKPTLVTASINGNTNVVKLLLQHGAKKHLGWALTEAIWNEHDEIIQLLSEQGAQVDDDDRFEEEMLDEPPLVTASISSNTNVVKLLLKHGAKKYFRWTLTEAIKHKHIEITKLLLEHGVPVDEINDDETPLIEASECGYTDIVKVLLEYGVNVDKKTPDGWTALMKASEKGDSNLEVIELLLRYGAQVDLQNNEGDSALMIASQNGYTDVVNLLLDKSVHVDIATSHRWTALMAASQNGHTEVVKLLLDRDVQVDITDAYGWTALMIASQNGHTDVVKLLLDKGAQVDIANTDERTALILASQDDHTDVVKLLIDKDAQLDIQDTKGATALILASQYGYASVVRLLLNKNAQVNLKDSDGTTALLLAADNGYADVVQLLLKRGANVDDENHDGLTALTAASQNGHTDIVKLLLTVHDDIQERIGISALEAASHSGCTDVVKLLLDNLTGISDEAIYYATVHGHSSIVKLLQDKKDYYESEQKLLAVVNLAIRNGGEINHLLLHGVFLGPPRSGKDSLMKRLTGEMPSDTSPSTGAAEKVIHVRVEKSFTTAATIEDSRWIRLKYDEEAIQLMKTASSKNVDAIKMQSCTNFTDPETGPSNMLDEGRSKSKQQDQESNTFNISEGLEEQSSIPHLTPNTLEPEIVQEMSIQRKHRTPMEVFKEAIRNEGMEGLKKHLVNTQLLYLTNTGGQMEFQELLPLLVSGPSVFFVTFQLHKSITETFSVVYELPSGELSKSYQSSLNVLEAILQTLSSIAAMGTYVYKGLQRKAVPLRPKVFIIGTHKDMLDKKSADTVIKDIDKHLQDVIKSTSHYPEGIIQFFSESQMIFAVNNHDSNDSDFQRIRSAVENLAEIDDYRMRSPAHWMVFSLVVRQLQNHVEHYDKCYQIAKECGIKDEKEFNEALHFIHTRMGLIRYFPHEELKDIVIIDPQILFEKVTELIVETFTFENVRDHLKLETFKNMGIFNLSDFKRISSRTGHNLTPTLFAKLLEHLRIAAPFQQDGVTKYFLPCALTHAQVKQNAHTSTLPQLTVTFQCGYCPKGLFGTLITYLINNEMQSEFEWELVADKIYRDEVCFQVGPYDTITLRFLPTHIEITCVESNPDLSRINCTEEDICQEVCQSVEKGIKTVTSTINYINAQHSFTFYCTSGSDECKRYPHPAKLMKFKGSLKCDKVKKCFPLPSGFEKWQLDSSPRVFETKATASTQQHTESETKLEKHHHTLLFGQLSRHASKWREIGIYLGFLNNELDIIAAKPNLYVEGTTGFLSVMLSQWLEWAPGDQRGSKEFATLKTLKRAVSTAGLGATAEHLTVNIGTSYLIPKDVKETCSTLPDINIHKTACSENYYLYSAKNCVIPHFLDEIKDVLFDSFGLEHKISGYDITVRIPESAIPKGQTIHLKVGAVLNGPFKSSSGKRPISPILWICPEREFTLSKPVEIVLPHILTNVTTEDVWNFGVQVAKANHEDFVTSPDDHIQYLFKPFEVNEMKFESNTTGNYVVMKVTHCCFLCLEAYRPEQMTPEVAQAMAKKKGYCMHCIECLQSPYPCWPPKEVIIFCVSFFMEKCIEAVTEQYSERNDQGELVRRVHKLQRFLISEPYIELKYSIEGMETPNMLSVAVSEGRKIQASSVDFWECGYEMDDMKLMHKKKMYPPSIEMTVQLSNQMQSQKPILSVSFEGCTGMPPFQFILPIVGVQTGQQHIPSLSHPDIPSYENAPAQLEEPLNDSHLCEILRKLKGHSSHWKKIGRELGFHEGELDNIEATSNRTVEELLCAMLSRWLQWAQGDSRGSAKHATLRALREAVDNAGFGRTANTLLAIAEPNAAGAQHFM